MTVLENIMFPLTVGKNKISKEEAQVIAEEYMQLTNIEELAGKPVYLPGGQQQRGTTVRRFKTWKYFYLMSHYNF